MTDFKLQREPDPKLFPKEWLDGLSDHVNIQVSKYQTQAAYAREINLSQTYVSLAQNNKFLNLGRGVISEIAYKTNYDRERVREFLAVIPERAVQYDNTKVRERVLPDTIVRTGDELVKDDAEKEVPAKEESDSPDVQVIKKYLQDKAILKNTLPSDLQPVMIRTLFSQFKEHIDQLQTTTIC